MNELKFLLQLHEEMESKAPDNLASIKEKILQVDENERDIKRIISSRLMKISLTTILFILLAGSVTVAAYNLSGADFFKKYYTNHANNNSADNSYIDLEQLDAMACSTVGTVVDTDEITIDVLGIVANGNEADIMLRITANQLDSVTRESDIEILKNYRFNDDTSGTLFESCETGSIRHYYADEVEDLASNQFEIMYHIVGIRSFNGTQYTIGLRKFGYFTIGGTGFNTLYDDVWTFAINFDTKSNSFKTTYINEPITNVSNVISINKISITPFSCFIDLLCNSTEDTASQISQYLYGEVASISIKFSDGTVLDMKHFENYNSSGDGKINITFTAPIHVEDVVSITIFGKEYKI